MPQLGANLFDTAEFRELVRRSNRGPLLRREVADDEWPKGWERDEVWHALSAVRRSEAYYNPFQIAGPSHPKSEWYVLPGSMQTNVASIAARTQRGSLLDSVAQEHEGARFITEQYVQEILANARYDGFLADYEGIRSVLLGDRTPMGTAEHLAANFHRIMVEMGRFALDDVTPQTICSLYNALCAGIEHEVALDVEPSCPVASSGRTLIGREPTFDNLLATEADLMTGALCEPTLPRIVLSLLVNCFFWRFKVFPRFNNFMGCILSRLFLYKEGYPVLRYAPKAWLYERWRVNDWGALGCTLSYRFEEAVVEHEDSDDFTVLYDSIMRLMLVSVERMEQSLGMRRLSDERAFAGIGRIPYLSYRQTEVLRKAVLEPQYEFGIREHQRKYGIAYSTARSDLMKLAERGYLSQTLCGSKIVFCASPTLPSLLVGEGK